MSENFEQSALVSFLTRSTRTRGLDSCLLLGALSTRSTNSQDLSA